MCRVAASLSVLVTLSSMSFAPLTRSDTVILDPIPVATVAGTAGLNGESFGYGYVYSSGSNVSYSAALASDGNFSVPTPAGSTYSLYAYLYQFQNAPGAYLRQYIYNQTALAESQTRLVDLRRQAGRVSGSVAVTGGTMESINLTANSSDASVPETFYGYVSVNSQPFLAVLPMPVVPSATTVSGSVAIMSSTGCRVGRSLPGRSVTVIADAEVEVQWTVDVSTETCSTGTLQGSLTTDGLNGQNSDALESSRRAYVSGPDYRSASLPANQTNYVFENLRAGSYSASQSVCFQAPYSCFSPTGQSGIQIAAGQITQYSRNLSLGTAHGVLAFRGPWGLPDLNFAYVLAQNSAAQGGQGYDYVDLSTGRFDLVLASGTTNLYYYYFQDSTYDPSNGDQSSWHIYENRYGGSGIGINVTAGGRTQLDPQTVDTSAASLIFQVAQQAGQPVARINRLDLNGSGYVRNPVTNVTEASRYISETDQRSASDVFNVSLRGLPGTYQMQARGYGTDGRQYVAAFEVALGAPDGTPAGTDVENQFTDSAGQVIGTLTFDNVLQGGDTTVSQVSLGPNAPRNFKVFKAGGQPQFFDIKTTAVFSGYVEVCVQYDDSNLTDPSNEAKLELGHYDEATATWEIITSPDSPDMANNVICGKTSGFSIFAILEVDVVDTDLDGVEDNVDNCPATANPTQQDQDEDGIGDACDADADGDAIPDATDLCPNLRSSDNSDLDSDGLGDPCDGDVDGDSVTNAIDNCPVIANADQTDFDMDSAGDQCDVDDDGDAIADTGDRCPGTTLGAVIDSDGCSSQQRFEVACPTTGAYRNHGQYASCVAKEADEQVFLGLINQQQKASVVSTAAQSDIGNSAK